jgi:transcriptional regulator with XRE-family HTH domain
MSSGYTLRLRDLNDKADKRKLGVRLGKLCIKHDVPVVVVAKRLGVSRATIYNWFCGVSTPQQSAVGLVELYITSLESAAV